MSELKIQEKVSLKELNTFGVDVMADYFVIVNDKEELIDIYNNERFKGVKKLILGGGSNILFVNDFKGLVIKNEIVGMKIEKSDDKFVWVTAKSGEDWDKLVTWTVEQGIDGIENLTMIPGTVGGGAAQNIAAYGQNFSDVFDSLQALDLETGKVVTMNRDECKFGYRTSLFKEEVGKYFILEVTLKLNKEPEKLETSYHERKGRYGSLEEELKSFAKEPYTVKDVYEAVRRQRTKRLPSVEEWGSCGSFFVNPLVTVAKFKELEKKVPMLQSYPIERLSYERKDWGAVEGEEMVKIPAGRILEELGWKGKWEDTVGVSEKHALCVVTKREATGQEILNFTQKMQKSVKDAYGVELKSEVVIVL